MDFGTPSPSPIPVVTVNFIDGSEKGKTFRIHKPVTIIGHELSKDIVIQGLSLSPEFARIISDNGAWRIEKRSQDIIVKVNEHVVIEKATLHDGDTIGFGPVIAAFRFENPLEGGRTQLLSPDPDKSPDEPLLEITSNTSQIRAKYTLPLSMQSISIGRDPSNDIVIDELLIDPFHLQIIRENNQLKLVHPHPRANSTTNGLWYQDNHIQGTEQFEHPLSQGDVFHIKNEYGTRVTLTYDDGSGATQGKVQAVDTIPLDSKHREIIIGRQARSDILLDHPTISKRHARIVLDRGGRYRIIDESSVGNVYVNGRPVKSCRLKSNDEIRIGPYRFVFTDTELKEYDERNSIRIDAYNLEKLGNKQKILLNNISLAVEPGSFVSLVGGSGAGKSTLMDALNGLRPAHVGDVYYNGQDYYRSLAAFRTQLGYVPQEDIVHKDLTVGRALYYVAKLRLPNDLVQERIEKVLTDVSLQPQRKLLVKQLSGGQRKRVSIALELLAEPSIFFLDEPTSGLDPGLDRQMMDLLRELADKGHTIVLVTHATNNINVCDYVCFLCQGGRMAYFGPPYEAATYFGKSDFAEIYSFLEPPDEKSTIPEDAETKFKGSPEYQKYVEGLLKPKPSPNSNASKRGSKMPKRGNPWKQFFLLSLRYFELLKNDIGNLAILLFQAPIIGLLLLLFIKGVGSDGFNPNNVVQCPTTAMVISAAGYRDLPTPINPVVSKSCQHLENFLSNNPRGKGYASKRGGTRKALQDFIEPGTGYAPTVLFIMAFSAILFGCINAAREFVKEVHIYRRERAVNLGIVPYMFSKIAVLGLLCLLQSLILVVFVNVFDPFSQSVFLFPFLEVYITIALTSLAGLMMGLAVSALAPNNDRAMSFVPLLLIPQVIFSGAIFPLNSWLLQSLGALFPIRWAMAALGSSVGLHSDKLNGDQLFGDIYTYHGTLFSTYSQADARYYLWLLWLALGVMIIIFAIAIAFFLKRKDKYR